MTNETTWITAHSGADGTPDNSLAFVRYALASGADALEVDVRRRPDDGALVLAHDEAGAGAPLLEQALACIAQQADMRVNCDLKEPGLERPVRALARRAGLEERLVYSGTVDPRQLRDAPAGAVFWNIDEQIPALYERCRETPAFRWQAAEEMCRLCAAAGVRTVNVYEGLVDDRFLEILDGYGMGASVWTVQQEARLVYFLSRGVRNITTRRLAHALSLRRAART